MRRCALAVGRFCPRSQEAGHSDKNNMACFTAVPHVCLCRAQGNAATHPIVCSNPPHRWPCARSALNTTCVRYRALPLRGLASLRAFFTGRRRVRVGSAEKTPPSPPQLQPSMRTVCPVLHQHSKLTRCELHPECTSLLSSCSVIGLRHEANETAEAMGHIFRPTRRLLRGSFSGSRGGVGRTVSCMDAVEMSVLSLDSRSDALEGGGADALSGTSASSAAMQLNLFHDPDGGLTAGPAEELSATELSAQVNSLVSNFSSEIYHLLYTPFVDVVCCVMQTPHLVPHPAPGKPVEVTVARWFSDGATTLQSREMSSGSSEHVSRDGPDYAVGASAAMDMHSALDPKRAELDKGSSDRDTIHDNTIAHTANRHTHDTAPVLGGRTDTSLNYSNPAESQRETRHELSLADRSGVLPDYCCDTHAAMGHARWTLLTTALHAHHAPIHAVSPLVRCVRRCQMPESLWVPMLRQLCMDLADRRRRAATVAILPGLTLALANGRAASTSLRLGLPGSEEWDADDKAAAASAAAAAAAAAEDEVSRAAVASSSSSSSLSASPLSVCKSSDSLPPSPAASASLPSPTMPDVHTARVMRVAELYLAVAQETGCTDVALLALQLLRANGLHTPFTFQKQLTNVFARAAAVVTDWKMRGTGQLRDTFAIWQRYTKTVMQDNANALRALEAAAQSRPPPPKDVGEDGGGWDDGLRACDASATPGPSAVALDSHATNSHTTSRRKSKKRSDRLTGKEYANEDRVAHAADISAAHTRRNDGGGEQAEVCSATCANDKDARNRNSPMADSDPASCSSGSDMEHLTYFFSHAEEDVQHVLELEENIVAAVRARAPQLREYMSTQRQRVGGRLHERTDDEDDDENEDDEEAREESIVDDTRDWDECASRDVEEPRKRRVLTEQARNEEDDDVEEEDE